MSKFILPTLLLGSLILLSFTTNPGLGVTRLGKFLYQVSSTAIMQESDKQEIANIIKSTYSIKDVNLVREITLKPVPFNGARGKNPNWVVDTKIGPLFVDKKAIHYDNKPDVPKGPEDPKTPTQDESLKKINVILTKYADMN